jgi:hypothetical protein
MPSLLSPGFTPKSNNQNQHQHQYQQQKQKWRTFEQPFKSYKASVREVQQTSSQDEHSSWVKSYRYSADSIGNPKKLKKKNRDSAPAQSTSAVFFEDVQSGNKAVPGMSTTTTVRVRSYQQQFSPVDTQAQHQIYEVQEAVQDGEMKHQPRRQSQSQAHPGVVASTPRFSMPPAPFQQPYPMYSGLQQAPMVRPKAFRDSAPIPLNVPRRLSSSSSPISQIVMDSNQAAQGVVAMSPRTSWSPPITSPMHYRFRRAVPRRSNETFAALPVEVLELILEKLKQLHLGAGSTSCTTCWMRDLCNVCLSSRKWAQSARAALYVEFPFLKRQ